MARGRQIIAGANMALTQIIESLVPEPLGLGQGGVLRDSSNL